jgi:Zn-dependent M28 family amino/carboxypeptidase
MLPKIRMPGKSYRGPMPPLTAHENDLRDALRRDVEKLAGEIGERNVPRYRSLAAAADFLEASLANPFYNVSRHGYEVVGVTCHNIQVEIQGSDRADQIIIIGAHYDSVEGSPGANDNATGAAAVLALARLLAGKKTSRTLRFVEFVNEEPPYFQSPAMGSLVYAKHCRKRGEKIIAMLSLETIGYYSDQKGSQHYPFPFGLLYPSTGNFIGFVGNTSSARLVRDIVASFRRHTRYPSEGGALPSVIPGISFSDQWAFWQQGYPGVMVTDTAPFRYPYYHTRDDTPDKVRYDHMAQVVAGLERVIVDIVGLIEK